MASLNNSCPSDTELSSGLPSPLASDDEDIQDNQDLGIVVPGFCNKLRRLTQHVFPKPEAVVLSDLCGPEIAKVKEEPKKKTFIKDETDAHVPRKAMVSQSHHQASPRWDTKSPSMRSYDPCDITGGDELEVAGVLFRSWTAGRDKLQQHYSNTDSDFPSLNETSLSERSAMSKSNDMSILGTSNPSLGSHRNKMVQSPSVSPVTSTPQNKLKNSSTQDSPLSHTIESPLSGNQSFNKSDPKSQSKSGSKSNRRRSKKLQLQSNPIDFGSKSPLDSSSTLDINANNCLPLKSPNQGQSQQGLDFDGNLRNPSLPTRRLKQQSGPIANEVSIDTRPASPSWNNIVKSSSPRVSPILRIDSPRLYNPATSKEEPKPVEINRRPDELRIFSSDNSPQLGTPMHGKKKDKERIHRAQLTSVDNSHVTPKKKSDSDTWSSQSNTAFENRFVERIAVSSTSPPKKVNPSPIKKLDFSHRMLDTSVASDGAPELPSPSKSDSVFKRQVSLISDLNWKKSQRTDQSDKDNHKGNSRGNKSDGNKDRNSRGKRAVFSLEHFVAAQKSVPVKDEISSGDVGEEKESGSSESKTKIDKFWINKSPGNVVEIKDPKAEIAIELMENARRMPKKTKDPALDAHSPSNMTPYSVVMADAKMITCKPLLRTHARQYCYYLESHHVTNLSKELLFILQLLTCSQEDFHTLNPNGSTIFESVHNCIYFAVMVIKRLKRLFSCLPKQTVCLLAMNHRVKAFSPKLHQYFKSCVTPKEDQPKEEISVTGSLFEPSGIVSSQNWSSTFSDIKMVHVFKCQRDNFFALYQRYQEADKDRPFPMEDQVHYVYNPQISEHKSVANLMHLAELFLDLLLRSSMQHSNDQVKYLEMVINSRVDKECFQKQYRAWRENNSALTLGSPAKWSKNELFFKDFLKAVRCPSFTEMLKNIIASKIKDLNNSDFDGLKSLHSSVCVPDDLTPQRCERFTNTKYRLCILAKYLGFVVFDLYAGAEDLSPEENEYMLSVREMTPLPLPLPLMLKVARDKGHLSLTVPWMVQYLSMMDAGAVKLTAYSHLINELCAIHRHAWRHLFCRGHHNAGLLITCCISWLFENPVLPSGLIYSRPEEPDNDFIPAEPGMKSLDTQRLVTSHLLYSCCPYLNAGHMPLVLFALDQKAVLTMRNVVPLRPSSPPVPVSTSVPLQKDKDVEELCQWLGLSLWTRKPKDEKNENYESGDETTANVYEGQVNAQPQVCNRFFASTKPSLDVLTTNFLQCHPYLSHCIHQSVDLLCGKVQDYTVNTLLKLAVFEARVKVRRKFVNMDAGEDANSIKDSILAKSNIMASKLSHSSNDAFFQTGESVCQSELPTLIHFLASHEDESIRKTTVDIAKKTAMSRLLEWAKVQLGPGLFQRVIINEAEKLSSTWSFKSCSLYPSDYLRKPEYNAVASPELSSSGFEHLQQLSKVLDSALACGSWYMNGQTRGPRPDDVFIQGMMEDFMVCINNHSVSLDFSFSIMVNFIMHLIIQYIVDAPQNWTDSCLDTFVQLCILYESKKCEDDRISFQPLETSHKSKSLKIKVSNLMSVFSLEWLSKSQALDHSLMVYCRTLVKLIEGDVISVERMIDLFIAARTNQHLPTTTRFMIDRAMVKILELLLVYTGRKTKEFTSFCCSVERVTVTGLQTHEKLMEWGSHKAATELQLVLMNADNGVDGKL